MRITPIPAELGSEASESIGTLWKVVFMIQLLKSNLRMLYWFAVGLICVFMFAFGLPLIQQASTATSPNPQVHAYTPKNRPGTQYWSAKVTRDSTHLPNF